MTKEIKKNKTNNLISIIDNFSVNFQTDRLSSLVEIFSQKISNIGVKVIHYSQVEGDMDILKSSRGIILTGSEINVSEFYNNKTFRNKFKSVFKLIKKAKNTPILAICFGLHLTGFAFKGKVYRMSNPHDGGRIIPLSLNKNDNLITQKKILVDLQHRDFIPPDDLQIQKKFEIIATKVLYGYNTIQYMRHTNRPIYAVQFHPEAHLANYIYRNQDDIEIIKKAQQHGAEIIINFVNICNQ